MEDPSLSKAESFAGVVLAVAAVDQDIAEEEKKCIQVTLARMRLFKDWQPKQYNAMFGKLTEILNTQGVDALLEMSIDALSPELYETAFTVSVDVVLSDCVVTEREKEFIPKLQQKLNVSDRLAEMILRVMLIKNRG